MNEQMLIDSKELRDNVIEHFEVLDKIEKELFLIPHTEMATTQQIADFYEVGIEAVKTIVKKHRAELTGDGLQNKTGNETKEILGRSQINLANFRGYFMADDIKFNNRNNLLFPRRAILRVGMLLRDSDIAREVRTQLLNIEEKASPEVKTADIEEEKRLMLNVGMAFSSGNPEAIMKATTEMMGFKNRHIEKLETTNKALTNGILEWEDRDRLNFAVRKLAYSTNTYYPKMWNELYKQLKYKYHIDLKKRGNKPYIEHIKENEWQDVIKCFSALCKANGYEPEEMFCDLEVK